MNIGENVRRLRRGRAMSQGDLAAAVHVHQTHISAIERGQKAPSLEVARLLAKHFDVSLDELVNSQPIPVESPL